MSAEPASAAASSSLTDPKAARAARMIPFIVGCALFMQMLDSTVVATALPAMAAALGSTPVRLNVAITSYLLAVAVFVPISGWAADRFGARRVFVGAIALFALSSVACALSQDLAQLVIARVVQGIAGAMMVPVGRVILLRTVPKQDLLKAMSFLSIPALLGPVIGPPLGGFMVTYMSWHWIFLINVPIGIIGIYLVLHFVEEIRIENAPRLDAVGFILSAVCLAGLVSGFEALGHGLLSPALLALLLAGGLACGLLYVWHAKRIEHPILDLSLLRIPTFAISTLGGNLCRFAVGAVPFLLAMMLQVGFGLSPFSAGMITFASAAGALLMKFVATPIVQHFGFRRVLTVNAVLTGLFIMCCAFFTPDTPVWLMILILLIGGFFRSLQFTGVNTLSYADIPPEKMSRASSFAAMAQQLGISLGVGVAAITLNLSMMARGADRLAVSDVVVAFITIGVLCALSTLSFRRLAPDAGAQLNRNKVQRDDE
ncbi:DHA2 family efflux MFS transporter permease subunit [Bordetella pseudohinzii]|uniref:High-copy suppressor of rspA n=1 Tax=Bordetella pseudohinzii TaxID=1331258 RepID=A0A0J6C431_9BORD|nr:DHA2 family efflux MFS transporter permease subunit [Bordetella pseudohinzii]ANY14812.1 MFS transporter [Bordetella pseudohinzii]KMM25833.1 major facilitator transporter [Bordetella pseudohinzii]KXA77671.1 MFS transporter [Bordetella pseudohinzii]KXA79323.1 MFS transporter [Bordetella pseudohinzii]CUJ16280.1 High-copy suppressor of rspA [Bordetella pseudohinzii]